MHVSVGGEVWNQFLGALMSPHGHLIRNDGGKTFQTPILEKSLWLR